MEFLGPLSLGGVAQDGMGLELGQRLCEDGFPVQGKLGQDVSGAQLDPLPIDTAHSAPAGRPFAGVGAPADKPPVDFAVTALGGLYREVFSAAAAAYLARVPMAGGEALALLGQPMPAGQLLLDGQEGLPGHDGLVVVLQEHLREVPLVGHFPVAEVIEGTVLLLQKVPGVLLIAQDTQHGGGGPGVPWV